MGSIAYLYKYGYGVRLFFVAGLGATSTSTLLTLLPRRYADPMVMHPMSSTPVTWFNYLITVLATRHATEKDAESILKGDDAVGIFDNMSDALAYLRSKRKIGATIGEDKTIVSTSRCELERAETTKLGMVGALLRRIGSAVIGAI